MDVVAARGAQQANDPRAPRAARALQLKGLRREAHHLPTCPPPVPPFLVIDLQRSATQYLIDEFGDNLCAEANEHPQSIVSDMSE